MKTAQKQSIIGAVQGDGAKTLTIPVGQFDKPHQIDFTTHQITIEPDAATTGTVAIQYKPWGASSFVDLLDPADGSPVVMSLADTDCLTFESHITAIKCTPSGADGTYNIFFSSWE